MIKIWKSSKTKSQHHGLRSQLVDIVELDVVYILELKMENQFTQKGDPKHPVNQGTLCPKGLTMNMKWFKVK